MLPQLSDVSVDIGSHSIYQTLVNFRPELGLTMPKLSKVLLLCDGPRFTDILLEEPARKKEVDGLYMWGTNVEVITSGKTVFYNFANLVCFISKIH